METLKVLQINIRSLWTRKDILETFIEKHNIQITIVCETWLKNNNINFKNYNLINKNRDDGYGGVAILIKKDIKFNPIPQNNYSPLETIETEIEWNNKTIKIISIYINPKTNLKHCKRQFQQLLIDNNNVKYTLIGGDINCHNQLWEHQSKNDRKGKAIAELITDNPNYTILNDGNPTYYNLSKNYSSAVDITLTSTELSKLTDWNIAENLTSDHMAIITEIRQNNNQITNKNYRTIHNQTKTINTLKETNIDQISKIEELTELIQDTIQNNSRIIPNNSKWRPKHWWSKEIEKFWHIKNQKQTLYNKHKTMYTAIELRKSNNKLKNLIREAKKKSWEEHLTNISNNNSQILWNKVNQIRKPHEIPTKFFDDQNNINSFLSFSFPNRNTVRLNKFKKNKPNVDIFNSNQILESLKYKKSKAPGYDGITYDILKKLPTNYINCISRCYNKIWKDQKFPEIWNNIKIIPIPKPFKDKHTIEGYRPISLLPVLLKLFNSVIKHTLETYFEERKLFPKNTIGFRKERSSNDIFLNLNNSIFNNKRKKLKQILISIDFSKAFDMVNIDKLIKILQFHKVDSNIINWLKQFLYNRKIIFRDDQSTVIITSSGIPQGSCISPLLFNIYSIQLHSIESDNVKVYQFADDFNILITAKNQSDLKREIKKTLNKFLKIAKKLKLPINAEKSGMLNLFKRTKTINEVTCQNLKFAKVDNLKILGIIFDPKMNFTKHHNSLKEKLQKDINLIKILSHLAHGINPKTALNIYKATIKSKLDYSSLFTAKTSKQNLEITQIIQNSALRAVLGLTKTTPIISIHNLSGIIPREFQNELNLANFFLKKLQTDIEFNIDETIYSNFTEKYDCLKRDNYQKIQHAEGRKTIRTITWERWSTRYKTLSEVKTNHLNSIWEGPMKIPWFKKIKMKNKDVKTINRLLTGHAFNNKFLHTIKARDNRKCDLCGDPEETINHILFKCKNLEASRISFKCLKQYNNSVNLFKNIHKNEYNNIIRFLDIVNKKL